jgi:hypothetical protein
MQKPWLMSWVRGRGSKAVKEAFETDEIHVCIVEAKSDGT